MQKISDVAVLDAREESEKAIVNVFEWAASVKKTDIPAAVQTRAVQILFDDVAAMVGAACEPEFQALLPKLGTAGTATEATVFCQGGKKTDRRNAAMINAVATNWLELDEGYRVTPCHAGLYVLPALLAEAEASNAKFDDLLHTLVVSYEVTTRIARAFSQRPAVMQSHGRFAALGSSVAVALSRKHSAAAVLAAASAAVTLIGPAPRNHLALGALVRNMWAAVGASSGMGAVDWADAGISGVAGSFYDVYCTVLGGNFNGDQLSKDLGKSWAVMEGYTKMYACCQHLHAAIEAVLDIRDDILKKGVQNIAAINVQTHDLALPLVNSHPHNTLAAKFSMSHAVAAAIVMGQGGADAFSSAAINDGKIGGLRPLVSMRPWGSDIPQPPLDRPARVTVQFLDGSSVEGECMSARGGSDKPFPPEALLAKIKSLTVAAYPRLPSVAEKLIAQPSLRANQGWREVIEEFVSR